jgi:hypothetical protein
VEVASASSSTGILPVAFARSAVRTSIWRDYDSRRRNPKTVGSPISPDSRAAPGGAHRERSETFPDIGRPRLAHVHYRQLVPDCGTIGKPGGLMAGCPRQDHILAVEDEPHHHEVRMSVGVREVDPRNRSSMHGSRGQRPVGRRLRSTARRPGRVGALTLHGGYRRSGNLVTHGAADAAAA